MHAELRYAKPALLEERQKCGGQQFEETMCAGGVGEAAKTKMQIFER
jgi:hypothetical protein